MTILPEASLIIEDAMLLYAAIMDGMDEKDEIETELLKSVKERAVRYAHIRAGWDLQTREQKISEDDLRTSAHDVFIVALTKLGRYQKQKGKTWMEEFDLNDRKRVGDFACYIALFLSLNAR